MHNCKLRAEFNSMTMDLLYPSFVDDHNGIVVVKELRLWLHHNTLQKLSRSPLT